MTKKHTSDYDREKLEERLCRHFLPIYAVRSIRAWAADPMIWKGPK